MSADTSPTKASYNRPRGNRRVKDFVGIHEELTKLSKGNPTVVENGNGRRLSSRSRVPARLPPTSKSSAHSLQESFKNPSVSEITELTPSPRKDDPALQYEDPVSTNHMQKQMDRGASSIDINRRPPTADRPVETDKYEDVRTGVKQNGLRRSNSVDKRSTGDRNSSPDAPNRSHSSGPGKTEQPASRSSSTASRQAERRRSLGGNNGNNPNVKQEAPKRSSPNSSAGKSMPSSNSNDGFLDFEFTAGSDYPPTKSSSQDILQDEEPANSAMQPYARHEGANGLKHEIDTADVGRLYTRKRSSGGKSTQENATDLATDPMGRDLGKRYNSNQDNSSHIPITRHKGNGNSRQEDQTDLSAHRHGRTGGNFKQDNAANSRAGSSEDRANNKTLDVVTYRSGTASVRTNRSVKWLLKGVAAASYNGGWLPYDEMVPYPADIAYLNKFLNDCRYEIEAGVPGRFLTVVLGNEISDLDSIVSTITYAYFLSSIGGQESKVFVPVINMRQDDLVLNTEAVWLFKATGLDTSKLLFVDQISLQYYHRFGNLKLVLVDHSRLAAHQETLEDSVVEIVDHNLVEELYPWVSTKDIQQVGSCCTIIAERFATEAPERLTGRGLNRLLLGPILLDTANLDPKSARCTARDMCMAAFLINGAGRYGQQGFFRLLRKMKFDMSTLSTIEMLRKDLKLWSLGPGKTDTYGLKGRVVSAAMSTLGVPLKEIMTRKGVLEDLRFFGKKLKLDLHLIVSGYYDNPDRYKREILLVPGDIELRDHLRTCFRPHKSELQLSYMFIPGLPDDMLVYNQGLATASRKILRYILRDYFEM